MTVDITRIPFADFGPDSLLVIRLPTGTQHDLRQVEEMSRTLRAHIHPSVAFVVMRDDTEVTHTTLAALVKRAGQCLCTPKERSVLDLLQ